MRIIIPLLLISQITVAQQGIFKFKSNKAIVKSITDNWKPKTYDSYYLVVLDFTDSKLNVYDGGDSAQFDLDLISKVRTTTTNKSTEYKLKGLDNKNRMCDIVLMYVNSITTKLEINYKIATFWYYLNK